MERIALVLGATGGIGGAVARRLAEGGWSVRALVRPASAARVPAQVMPVMGDAMDGGTVAAAAMGAQLIVHAVNPPGYRDWNKVVLPMLDNSIAAARAQGARVLLPGTVYNYGPDSFPLIAEDAPQHPLTRKGAIRAEMEHKLHSSRGQFSYTGCLPISPAFRRLRPICCARAASIFGTISSASMHSGRGRTEASRGRGEHSRDQQTHRRGESGKERSPGQIDNCHKRRPVAQGRLVCQIVGRVGKEAKAEGRRYCKYDDTGNVDQVEKQGRQGLKIVQQHVANQRPVKALSNQFESRHRLP